jgi:hypothetical protein
MKKIISALFAATAVIACFDFTGTDAQANEAKFNTAQIKQAVGTRCCDSYGNARCYINPSYIGTACFCNYQGWGFVC